MFISELSPIFKEFTQHPVSFLGGFVSGVLRLNLVDDPVKSWLDRQVNTSGSSTPNTEVHNGKATGGPQRISIE